MRFRVLFTLILIILFGIFSVTVLASVASNEVKAQAVAALFSGLVFLGLQIPDPQFFKRLAPGVAGIIFVLLMLTMIAGRNAKGSVRWLTLGQISVQPSEFAKPTLALLLAYFVRKYPLRTQRRVFVYFLLTLAFCIPVFLQPDFGSAMVLTAVSASILFFAIEKLRLLLPWIVLGTLGVLLIWNFALYPYQKQRILAFAHPNDAIRSSGYNAQQAMIAVGSGKLEGRGLGHGIQSQLRFLPERQTDFFFASMVEETGFVGGAIVLLGYTFLGILALRGTQSLDPFARLAIIGIGTSILFQAIIHAGMDMRLFPVTGIPLPLLSAGGSSFLATCIGLGLIMRLHTMRLIWYTTTL
ncbi:MAG TPA: FtsW/RodA/SpoVE family cell cycle protein [Patescibacteria group bacterium]|nr:FtsW/RodA/SpoVE family cell cycle protein [Patescibacteria group bacterium]